MKRAEERRRREEAVIIIQSRVQGFLQRKRYQRMKEEREHWMSLTSRLLSLVPLRIEDDDDTERL